MRNLAARPQHRLENRRPRGNLRRRTINDQLNDLFALHLTLTRLTYGEPRSSLTYAICPLLNRL